MMDKAIEGLFQEWQFMRSCTKAFVNELSDSDLDKKLPRRGLDTFRKHFQEIIEVQRDYITAIESGEMTFNGTPDSEIDGLDCKDTLLENMERADADLHEVLGRIRNFRDVQWFGINRPITYHLAALISHEALHVGQIIAFCYVLGIEVPEYVRKNWALSGK